MGQNAIFSCARSRFLHTNIQTIILPIFWQSKQHLKNEPLKIGFQGSNTHFFHVQGPGFFIPTYRQLYYPSFGRVKIGYQHLKNGHLTPKKFEKFQFKVIQQCYYSFYFSRLQSTPNKAYMMYLMILGFLNLVLEPENCILMGFQPGGSRGTNLALI